MGDQDQLSEGNRNFHALLDHLHIESEFVLVPGLGHNQKLFYATLGEEAFQFYGKAFA